jgi:hypothetical protein
VGFSGALAQESAVLEEVEPLECARLLPESLPWQLAPATVAGLALPARAFRLGPAVAVVADDRLDLDGLLPRSFEMEPEGPGHNLHQGR